MFPEGEETAKFSTYHYPKIIEDSPDVFPSISRIPNAMLSKVDSANHILVSYLQTINPSNQTGVLLKKSEEGPLKKHSESKKDDQPSPVKPSPSKASPVLVEKLAKSPNKVVKGEKSSKNNPKPIVKETTNPSNEVVPINSGILKRLKKWLINHAIHLKDH